MPSSMTIAPHGSALINRVRCGGAREEARVRLGGAPRVTLNEVALTDLKLNAVSVFRPLTGLLVRADDEWEEAPQRAPPASSPRWRW